MWMDKVKALLTVALVLVLGFWFAMESGCIHNWFKGGGKPSALRARVDKASLIGSLEEVRDRLREMHDRSFASYDTIWETNNFGVRADIAFTSGGTLCNSP